MSITAALVNSFKAQLLAGVHQPGDDYKIALYSSNATLNKGTTAYTAAGETVGTGYTAGGVSLSGYSAGASGDVAWIDWSDPVWNNSTFTARGALIYNATRANAAVAVLDFGADVSSTNTPFTVQMPVAGPTTAVVRVE